jgi:hypothetical protein
MESIPRIAVDAWSAISTGNGKRVKAMPKSSHVLASLISNDFPNTNVEAS